MKDSFASYKERTDASVQSNVFRGHRGNCWTSSATSFSVICVVCIKCSRHAKYTLRSLDSGGSMTHLLTICLAIWAIIDIGQSISTKLDFEEEKESSVSAINSSKNDEDVEVNHTIVVSTRLKNNNNRRALHNEGDNIAQTFSIGHATNVKKEDSGEVPIIKGYKSVESTFIRTPDTRGNLPSFTDPVFINRDIRDGYVPYPVASNPSQWKPSSFFNNVNWWNDDSSAGFNDVSRRRDWPNNRNQVKFHRTITDDGVKEFYCRKCRELSSGPGNKGCIQQRSNAWYYESTTPKIKIDGKIAKFN